MSQPSIHGFQPGPEPATTEQLVARFEVALDLAETGIGIMRENLRRRHPDASPDELETLLAVWLRRRPPDGPGRLRVPQNP